MRPTGRRLQLGAGFAAVLWILTQGSIARSAMTVETTPGFPPHLSLQAHRGAAGLAPENTLAAFRMALDLGADGTEMDLQVTKDGVVVVIHDDTVDRTTDGRGRIGDLTLAEIKRLDAGAKFGPVFRGERIPTLRELIDLVRASGRERFRLNLEIKFVEGREGHPADLEERVLAVLTETNFLARVITQSFYHPSAAKMKRLAPGIPAGLLVGQKRQPPDPVAAVRDHRVDYYAPHHSLVTPELLRTLHQAGIPVVTWTVNDPADMRRLISMGLGALPGDGMISDYPDRLVDLRKARQ
jgi:glycerophosphoryl diester phosphodiesterase